MKASSDLDSKIICLQQEIKNLKAAQILGGDNSRVYRYCVEGVSPLLYKKDGQWVRKSDYDDPDYYPVPMSNYSITSLVYPAMNDPFALVNIERIEVRRGDKLLTWSDYEYYQGNSGQHSQYGDYLSISLSKIGHGWGDDTSPRLGTAIRLTIFPKGNLSDNPSSPIQYSYKVWVRSTSLEGYLFLPDSIGED